MKSFSSRWKYEFQTLTAVTRIQETTKYLVISRSYFVEEDKGIYKDL